MLFNDATRHRASGCGIAHDPGGFRYPPGSNTAYAPDLLVVIQTCSPGGPTNPGPHAWFPFQLYPGFLDAVPRIHLRTV